MEPTKIKVSVANDVTECAFLPNGDVVLVGGEVMTNVHSAADCAGAFCCIHRPSDHHMRSWRMHWRDDRGIMERICPDRIGHPDPDDYRIHYLGADDGTHGCDGCCFTGRSWHA